MKLTEIKIKGYKSIAELGFPIKKYGDSYTTILLGKNESGKSNVLDAMATPKLQEAKSAVDFIKIKNQQNEPQFVQVYFHFELDENDTYRDVIASHVDMPQELLDGFKLKYIEKEIYLSSTAEAFDVDVVYDYEKTGLKKYSFVKTSVTIPASLSVAASTVEKIVIKANADITEEEKPAYAPLTRENFEDTVRDALLKFVEDISIPVDIWKSEEQYLIKDKIQLKDFAQAPESNLPLKNMFYLAGYETKEKIVQVVGEIEKDSNKRKNLKKMLSKKTTAYLNTKWEEHKISIDVEVESDLNASVSVQDNADEDHYFDMADRSQGFKQFVSLLLSISISSASGDTKDHLILIDEPEVHLHPSGVRFMLEELLEIGKHNYLFISTHSNFMLDRDTKERHYLLTKDKNNLTTANQITTDEDINDDEVLQTAFGINVISDFLSPHKLLVEGETDKILLQKALSLLKKDHDVLITNGTGANIVATASLLSFHHISPMVVVDDDEAGQKAKPEILKISNHFAGKVFTIRDLSGGVISDGSIEDTLPITYVQSQANSILSSNSLGNITLNTALPFCQQIKAHLKNEIIDPKGKKQKVDGILATIKYKIAENYKATPAVLKKDAPLLNGLAEAILAKFGVTVS
ncbi:AAA family ATPase [Candidatus Saccharibacteria bacterium]|nr:AAA family ATPase [Candidatus Saccharibacteria bacterium]